jgi:C4-dicarboxylate transporter DctM subunit
MMVVLILLAVRIWVVIGVGSFAMLLLTGVLPPTLLGEALFDGIDSFALIAVPLFILTGDILVRTGLSGKAAGRGRSHHGLDAIRIGNVHRAGLRFFCLYQRL